jgi:hypothetical protein
MVADRQSSERQSKMKQSPHRITGLVVHLARIIQPIDPLVAQAGVLA